MPENAASREVDRDLLVDALGALGMGQEDAEVYLRLSASGPQKAGPLARLMGWNRPETYRVLQRLVEREFVEAALSRPVVFRAVPVERLFAQLQRLQHDRLARIGESRALVEDLVARLQARAAPEAPDAGLRVIHGRHLVHATASRMVGEARESILVAFTAAPGARALALSGVVGQALRRAGEGLAVRMVLDAAQALASRPPTPAAAALRGARPGREACFLVVDQGEALCWLSSAATARLHEEGDAALWTNARGFVAMQAGHFELLWADSPA